MILLGFAWHTKNSSIERIAPIGWVLTGFFFFNDTPYYLEAEDLVLTVMSAACLPGAIGIFMWERRATKSVEISALKWFRGAVFYAGFPYLLIAHVPILNVLAIWFVAWQSCFMLRLCGLNDVHLGESYVDTGSSTVLWSEWEGNKWFMTETMGEYPFYTELVLGDGGFIGINFILACTAIQSMIIFVGAIVVLDLNWKKRVRALLISLPIIHILNLFRNAGLIWLHITYDHWDFYGLTVFEFGHAYAARVVSLGAMFLMALVMFELLPAMHKHVMTLMEPFRLTRNQSTRSQE